MADLRPAPLALSSLEGDIKEIGTQCLSTLWVLGRENAGMKGPPFQMKNWKVLYTQLLDLNSPKDFPLIYERHF